MNEFRDETKAILGRIPIGPGPGKRGQFQDYEGPGISSGIIEAMYAGTKLTNKLKASAKKRAIIPDHRITVGNNVLIFSLTQHTMIVEELTYNTGETQLIFRYLFLLTSGNVWSDLDRPAEPTRIQYHLVLMDGRIVPIHQYVGPVLTWGCNQLRYLKGEGHIDLPIKYSDVAEGFYNISSFPAWSC